MNRRDSGSAVVELSLGAALIVFPLTMLIAFLPSWFAADEIVASTASEASLAWASRSTNDEGLSAAAAVVAANASTWEFAALDASYAGTWCPGCEISTTVSTQVPAFQVPFIGSLGTVNVESTSTIRLPDHRSLDVVP